MVDRLRPMGRVPTVNTPTRVRQTRRERHRQGRRDHQSRENPQQRSVEEPEAPAPGVNDPAREGDNPAPGQRINVVI